MLQATETEEKYATITWPSRKEQIFEISTSGVAIMQKRAVLSTDTQLRTHFKINDYKIYRIFPNPVTD